jgi:tRNA (cytidine56-2'-O)-methyltransferase
MIVVLRLGHRPSRDKRVTTHVALTARAFGADKVLISTQDDQIVRSLECVCKRFGGIGTFEVQTGVNWREYIDKWTGVCVHLTMYGEPLDEVIPRIPRDRALLVIVGAEKVPGIVYNIVDYNVAVGNQPHSEIAALAIFLDRYTQGSWITKRFNNGKFKIIPSKRGKKLQVNQQSTKT